MIITCWFSKGSMSPSVQFSHSVVSDSLWLHEPQHTRPPCPSPAPRVYPNLCPLSQWCHPTISSSVIPFFSCPQSFHWSSGSFQMSQLFASGGQSIGVSASTSLLPVNTQGWSPSEWTGWISLQSKGLSRVFSNTTVQKNQFFCAQVDVFSGTLFFADPEDAGNLISGFSAFSKSNLKIWKLTVHVLLKPGLENFDHYFASVWDECNCVVVWTFFGIAFL